MASRPRRGSRAPERSRRGGSSSRVLAVASVVASGSVIDTPNPAPALRSATLKLGTRATYRTLIMRGMAPDEAANLTAFMAGLPVAEGNWTLKQINELLFLRRMRETGKLNDWDAAPAH